MTLLQDYVRGAKLAAPASVAGSGVSSWSKLPIVEGITNFVGNARKGFTGFVDQARDAFNAASTSMGGQGTSPDDQPAGTIPAAATAEGSEASPAEVPIPQGAAEDTAAQVDVTPSSESVQAKQPPTGTTAPSAAPAPAPPQLDLRGAIASRNPANVAAVMGRELTAAVWQGGIEAAKSNVANYRTALEHMGAREWTDEQWNAFRSQTIAAGFNMEVGGIPPEVEQKLDKVIRDTLQGAATKEVAEISSSITENPDSGFGDWITSNWQNFLIPAGMLAMLFGGRIGQVLGIIAVGAGGYNLYSRYNNLVADPNKATDPAEKARLTDIQKAIAASMRMKDEHDNRVPLKDPNAGFRLYWDEAFKEADLLSKTPEERTALEQRLNANQADIVQALQDMKLIAGLGFTEQIVERVKTGANDFINGLWGPAPQAAAEGA